MIVIKSIKALGIAALVCAVGATACGPSEDPDANNQANAAENQQPGDDNMAMNNTAMNNTTANNTSMNNSSENNSAENNTAANNMATNNMAVNNTATNNTSANNTAVNNTAMNNTTPSGPTYHQDVKPLLNNYCTRCHYAEGQGPIDFTDANTVQNLGDLIVNAIDEGRMPPAVADPDCRDYHGSDQMVLSEEAKATLSQWIAAGKPMGEDDGVIAAPPETSSLSNPDIEMRITNPYTPTYADPANANNEYRCFVLEHNQPSRFYITGMHPIVDTPEIVHHVVLAKTKRSKLPEGILTADGQNCIDDMSALGSGDDGDGIIGAWAPGMEPVLFDEAGLEVTIDDVFVLQMHYYSGKAATDGLTDQSGYALKTAESVKNKLLMAPLGLSNFVIPAGDDNYSASDSVTIPVPITLWGVFPHMHVLGKSYELTVGEGDEQICANRGEKYDFNNQLTYMFKDPLYIAGNTPINFRCTWDNSADNPNLINKPPTDVKYGERTDEEMCFAFSYVSIGPKR